MGHISTGKINTVYRVAMLILVLAWTATAPATDTKNNPQLASVISKARTALMGIQLASEGSSNYVVRLPAMNSSARLVSDLQESSTDDS